MATLNNKSKALLKDAINDLIGSESLANLYICFKETSSCNDDYIGFIWKVYHSIPSSKKDCIMEASNLKCVGGYYDVKDSAIETLLKKVITKDILK